MKTLLTILFFFAVLPLAYASKPDSTAATPPCMAPTEECDWQYACSGTPRLMWYPDIGQVVECGGFTATCLEVNVKTGQVRLGPDAPGGNGGVKFHCYKGPDGLYYTVIGMHDDVTVYKLNILDDGQQ